MARCKPCHRAAASRWQRENVDRVNAKNARWRRGHPVEARAQQAKYRDAHRLAERERGLRYAHTRRGYDMPPIRAAALEARWAMFGGKCWMCGESATAWDHVKPMARGGLHLAANLRPACGPCNSGKRHYWPTWRWRDGVVRSWHT